MGAGSFSQGPSGFDGPLSFDGPGSLHFHEGVGALPSLHHVWQEGGAVLQLDAPLVPGFVLPAR